MLDAGVGAGAFLLADDANALAPEAPKASDQGFILGELAVARERREFGDETGDEIGEMRPLRMARHQRLLPRRQIRVEVPQRLRSLFLDPGDLLADVAARCRKHAQFVDLGIEFGDGFFEIEIAAHVIRHQINIGAKLSWSEATPGLHEESTHLQIFSVRSKVTIGSLGPTLGSGVSGKGSFGGEGAEVKEFAMIGITIKPGGRGRRGQCPGFEVISPPADADRAPGFSGALRPRGYRSGSSICRCGRAASARCAGRRRCAKDDWRRRGAARAVRPAAAPAPPKPQAL